jgi:phosphatidylserine decarboxylase
MTLPSFIERVLQQETVNFFVTNRIPRRLLTRLVGWFSRLEQPLVRDLSIGVLTLFAGDLRLDEARTTTFASLHDCFVRELKDGARPLHPDPRVLVSPCDGIVGAFGRIDGTELLQVKGSRYSLGELLGEGAAIDRYRDGHYVTLRLTSNMYHRFHAPCACRVDGATYIPGDVWNVNPIALKRIPRLYCRNERLAIDLRVGGAGESLTLVAVGAVLVGSIHPTFAGRPLPDPRPGVTPIPCGRSFRKGDELGYFHYGSTIVVIAGRGLAIDDHVRAGSVLRTGEPLLRAACVTASPTSDS